MTEGGYPQTWETEVAKNQRTFVIFFASTKFFFLGAMTLAPRFGARIELLFWDVSV